MVLPLAWILLCLLCWLTVLALLWALFGLLALAAGGEKVPDKKPKFTGWLRDDDRLWCGWAAVVTGPSQHVVEAALEDIKAAADPDLSANLTSCVNDGCYPGGDRDAEPIPCHKCHGEAGQKCNNCRGRGFVPGL